MPGNEASPETQFALLRSDISNLTKMVRELVERMSTNERENRQKLDEHERRLTIVEERQTGIREFKNEINRQLIGFAVKLGGVLIVAVAIAAIVIANL